MKFAEIPGHEKLKRNLLGSVAANRISHALLLSGPEGSGAFQIAQALAQYLLCTAKSPEDSCGECPSCVKCQTVQHPDFHYAYPTITQKEKEVADSFYVAWREMIVHEPFFDKADWESGLNAENKQLLIPVKEARSILDKLSLTAYMGGHKMMLMWMPELMNIQAANALLKVLEEPPEGTVFLLVSHDREQLLPTIYSRCQFIKVSPYENREVADYLVAKGINSELAGQYAALAEGSLREALRLTSGTEENEHYLSLFIKLSRAAYKGSVSEISQVAAELHELGRERQKQFISYSLHLMRQALVLNYNAAELAHLNDDEADFMTKFAPFINHVNIVGMAREFNNAFGDISGNVYGRIVFMDMGIKLFELFQRPE